MVRTSEALLHRVLETTAQRSVFNPELPHTVLRRLMNESRVHLSDSRTVTVKRTANCAREALLQVIEPLLLLHESQAWMRQIQALAQGVEPRPYRSKLTLDTRTESLLQLVHPLGLLIQPYAGMREFQARAGGTESSAEGPKFTAHPYTEPLKRSCKRFEARIPVWCYEFRCTRRRRSSCIRNKIADGEINLVADAGDDGYC